MVHSILDFPLVSMNLSSSCAEASFGEDLEGIATLSNLFVARSPSERDPWTCRSIRMGFQGCVY